MLDISSFTIQDVVIMISIFLPFTLIWGIVMRRISPLVLFPALFLCSLFFGQSVFATSVTDDFESYSVGDNVSQMDSYKWSGNSGHTMTIQECNSPFNNIFAVGAHCLEDSTQSNNPILFSSDYQWRYFGADYIDSDNETFWFQFYDVDDNLIGGLLYEEGSALVKDGTWTTVATFAGDNGYWSQFVVDSQTGYIYQNWETGSGFGKQSYTLSLGAVGEISYVNMGGFLNSVIGVDNVWLSNEDLASTTNEFEFSVAIGTYADMLSGGPWVYRDELVINNGYQCCQGRRCEITLLPGNSDYNYTASLSEHSDCSEAVMATSSQFWDKKNELYIPASLTSEASSSKIIYVGLYSNYGDYCIPIKYYVMPATSTYCNYDLILGTSTDWSWCDKPCGNFEYATASSSYWNNPFTYLLYGLECVGNSISAFMLCPSDWSKDYLDRQKNMFLNNFPQNVLTDIKGALSTTSSSTIRLTGVMGLQNKTFSRETPTPLQAQIRIFLYWFVMFLVGAYTLVRLVSFIKHRNKL